METAQASKRLAAAKAQIAANREQVEAHVAEAHAAADTDRATPVQQDAARGVGRAVQQGHDAAAVWRKL